MSYPVKDNFPQHDVRAIIFDLDDTLYPEYEFVLSGFRQVAKLIGARYRLSPEEIYHELVVGFDSGIRGRNFDVLLQTLGIHCDHAMIGELVDLYRKHEPEIFLPKESKHVLSSLKVRGYLLGIISDGYLETQMNKVKSLKLETFFDAIIFTDMWGREFWKPHKKAYEEICRALNVEGKNCCYIADNPIKDFKGAKECGMLSIQVLHWDKKDATGLDAEYLPDLVLGRLEDILEVFHEGSCPKVL
ncbi:MAG: HAD family hydrolase [Thermoproteota archaeon]